MALSIRVKGLDLYGVGLLPPTRQEFDELARPLIGERIADAGLRLKPMLVIVSNENVRTVVSLSLVWCVTHRDGRTSQFWGHTSFPDVICGDSVLSNQPAGLGTGQHRIEANGLVLHGWGNLDGYFDQFLDQFVEEKERLLANAVDLSIELNAVIFADGTLIGADDDSMLSNLFAAYVQAKQTWYRGIIVALDGGQSVPEAFAPVERFLLDSTNRARGMWKQPPEVWIVNAAAEARRWHCRYADEEIPFLMKQTIRLDSFTIRRQ